MSSERARRTGAATILALLLMAAAVWVWRTPAVWPEAWIEQHLTRSLPPDPTIVAVRTLVESNHWRTTGEHLIADRSVVTVLLGRDPLRRLNVYAEFAFDRFGQLVDVRVEKRR